MHILRNDRQCHAKLRSRAGCADHVNTALMLVYDYVVADG
jgi:hypothetical protein